jgi:hypothetical protein
VGGSVFVGSGLCVAVEAGALISVTTGWVAWEEQPAKKMEARKSKSVFFMEPAVRLILLFIQESDDNVQNDRKHNRKNNGSHTRNIKRGILSLDLDITGQFSKRDTEPGGQKYTTTDQNHDEPPDHQPTGKIFHIQYPG